MNPQSVRVNFGALSPPIDEQLRDQGLKLDMDPVHRCHLQRDADEVTAFVSVASSPKPSQTRPASAFSRSSKNRPNHYESAMTVTYRVEAHDGNSWGFGIRTNPNSRVPEFCALSDADRFGNRSDAFDLADAAARLCGGTLRVIQLRGHGSLVEVQALPIA
jgi:hypothetical protein